MAILVSRTGIPFSSIATSPVNLRYGVTSLAASYRTQNVIPCLVLPASMSSKMSFISSHPVSISRASFHVTRTIGILSMSIKISWLFYLSIMHGYAGHNCFEGDI